MKRILLCLLLLLLPGVAAAQEETPQVDEQALQEYLDGRAECLDVYRLGSVHFGFKDEAGGRTFTPGQTVTITGSVTNTNAYPMPEGRITARILRQDAQVAADNWHPVVAELEVPGIFNLPAGATQNFTMNWNVPARAPEGIYRAEFNFLAGGRYSISGLAFVANFTGASRTFMVQGASNPAAVSFDRGSVRLNGEAYALRSVPPTFQPGQQMSITASLEAGGSAPVPITLTSELHEWSDSDREGAVVATTSEETITPGQALEVPFTWQALPGVYELVLKATPKNPAILPSMLKVRFPVEGNTPRIIYSGVTGFAGSSAEVTTCVVNGTFGSGSGTIATQVTSDGQLLSSTEGAYDADGLTTLKTRVPVDNLGRQVGVTTKVANSDGVVTDTHTLTYGTQELLAEQIAEAKAAQRRGLILTTILVVAGLAVIALLMAFIRRRRRPAVPPAAQAV